MIRLVALGLLCVFGKTFVACQFCYAGQFGNIPILLARRAF